MKEVKLGLNPLEYILMGIFSIMKLFRGVYTNVTVNAFKLMGGVFYGDELIIERVHIMKFGMVRVTSKLEDSRDYRFTNAKYSEIYKYSGIYSLRDVIEYISLNGVRVNISKGIDIYMLPSNDMIAPKDISFYMDSISIMGDNNEEEKKIIGILARKTTKENPTLVIVGIPEYVINLSKHLNGKTADRYLLAYITYINNINSKLLNNMR